MTKTGHQIESDVFALLSTSSLASGIGGKIYRGGTRPRDSREEDLVVIFTTADAEQFQSGIVTLNIYVPDIYPYGDGVPVENISRCETLEILAQSVVDSLNASVSDYLFSLRSAIHTTRDSEIEQSFVVVQLQFRYFNNSTQTTTSD